MGHGGGWAASPPFPPRGRSTGDPASAHVRWGGIKTRDFGRQAAHVPKSSPTNVELCPGIIWPFSMGGVSGSPQPHSPGSPGAANPEPLERFCRSLAGKQVTHFTTITDSPLCGGHPPARDPSGNTLAPTVQNFLVGGDQRETRCLPDVSLHQKGRRSREGRRGVSRVRWELYF